MIVLKQTYITENRRKHLKSFSMEQQKAHANSSQTSSDPFQDDACARMCNWDINSKVDKK